LKKLSAHSGSATSVFPKIDLTLRAFRKKMFLLTCVMNRWKILSQNSGVQWRGSEWGKGPWQPRQAGIWRV